MTPALFSPAVRRRTVEPALGAITVILALLWITEPGFVFDGGLVAMIAVFVPVTLLAPGLLAVSVLARVVRHGVRLVSMFVGSGDRVQRGDTSLRRIGMSLVLGALAGITLYWVVGSVYVLTVADMGGVMLAPVVAIVVGSVLGVLLLCRTVLEKLRLKRDAVHVLGETD